MSEPRPPARVTKWRNGQTKSIRVPAALADRILAYARELDREGPVASPAPLPASALPTPRATAPLAPPAWVRDAVFYQIFPERFFNGDKANDPAGVKRWGSTPRNFNYFGGDLAGVRQKLPYLQKLGVTALYMNPLFKAHSNHKYNTSDYMRIDPAFGTNAEFEALVADCHARGVRVVLDGVFNHTGDRHPFFNDCVKNGPRSRYWNWYTFFDYPVVKGSRPNYGAWWGYASLPKLRVAANREVQEYIFAVTEHWTRLGIDGWRLDVPNEIDNPAFWQEWRQRVRAINPEAYLIGELWDEGLGWIHGHPFDATMNYVFRQAMLDFFAYRRISVDELDFRLADLRAKLGPAASDASFNLLASHDVPRFRTEAGGDLQRVREAVFFQFVFPGAPVIYYGEELGMLGGKDPDNRRCMPWSKVPHNELLAFFQRLITLKREHPALRGGDMKTLLRHNDFRLLAFLREGRGERLLVVMNSGLRARPIRLPLAHAFPDGARLTDYLGGGTYTVAHGALVIDSLAPQTGLILGL